MPHIHSQRGIAVCKQRLDLGEVEGNDGNVGVPITRDDASELLNELPTGRSFQNLAILVPGVQPTQLAG